MPQILEQAATTPRPRLEDKAIDAIMPGSKSIETIPKSSDKIAGVHGVLPEAALFSVVRPNQLKTDVAMSVAVDGLSGRSLSLKTPLTRKAREWVKRSNTSR
jgi:hypothetical protein